MVRSNVSTIFMKKIIILYILTNNVIFGQGLVDGFSKGKNKLDLAFGAFYQHSDIYFAGRNPIQYERNLIGLSAFGAFGVTDKLDVIASIPVINFQFQDASLFVKYKVIDTKIKESQFSLFPAIGISFPTSNYATETGQAIGQRATQIQPKLIGQYTFPKQWFIQVQGGYNYTLDPVPSSAVFSSKIGFYRNKIYADLWFEQQEGFGSIDYKGSEAFSTFRQFVVSYQRIGGTFYYQPHKKVGYTLGASYILNGRNIGKAIAYNIGIVLKLDTTKKSN